MRERVDRNLLLIHKFIIMAKKMQLKTPPRFSHTGCLEERTQNQNCPDGVLGQLIFRIHPPLDAFHQLPFNKRIFTYIAMTAVVHRRRCRDGSWVP